MLFDAAAGVVGGGLYGRVGAGSRSTVVRQRLLCCYVTSQTASRWSDPDTFYIKGIRNTVFTIPITTQPQ